MKHDLKKGDSHMMFPEEHVLKLQMNEDWSVKLVCTRDALTELIFGFLYNEGIIQSVKEVSVLEISEDGSFAKLTLDTPLEKRTMVRTSGLGGQQTDSGPEAGYCPIGQQFSIGFIQACVSKMNSNAKRYQFTGGIHCSAVFTKEKMLAVYEDIGRHNTLDKLTGYALLHGLNLEDTLLLTTGRVSSDMVKKALRMGVSAIASYSTPTQFAYELAETANMSLLGYVQRNLQIYNASDRILS